MHPEMAEVKPGEELMGITFKEMEVDDLQQSLQSRIEELNQQEEDDDDGDIVVRV